MRGRATIKGSLPQGRLNLPRLVCPGPDRQQRLERLGPMLRWGRKPSVDHLEIPSWNACFSFVIYVWVLSTREKNSPTIDFVSRFSIQRHKFCAKFGSASNFLINLDAHTSLIMQHLRTIYWGQMSAFKLQTKIYESLNGWGRIIHTSFCWKHDDDMFWQFSTEHVTFMQEIALNDINNNIVVFAGGFNWTFAGLTKNHLVLLCHVFKDLTELSWSVAVVTS